MMARAIPLVMVLVFVLVATSHAQMVSLNRIFGRYQQFQWQRTRRAAAEYRARDHHHSRRLPVGWYL